MQPILQNSCFEVALILVYVTPLFLRIGLPKPSIARFRLIIQHLLSRLLVPPIMLVICKFESLPVFNSISQFLFRIRTVVHLSVYIINNTKYFILVDGNYIKLKYHANCREYQHQSSFLIWIVNYSIAHNMEYKNLCISPKTDITSYSHIFLQFRITAFHRFIRFYQCN